MSAAKLVRVALCCAIVAAVTGCGDATYDDCILHHVKPGMSNGAAALTAQACHDKFDPKPPPSSSGP